MLQSHRIRLNSFAAISVPLLVFASAASGAGRISYEEAFTLVEPAQSTDFGRQVAPADDWNGDGFTDLFVLGFTSTTGESLGVTWVYSGLDGSLLDVLFSGTPGLHLEVSLAGDVDADGIVDYMYGDDFVEHRAFCPFPDICVVLSGADQAEVLVRPSIKPIGDTNQDGHADFLQRLGTTAEGVYQALSGENGGVLYIIENALDGDGLAPQCIVGNRSLGTLGGDITGDGIDDLFFVTRDTDVGPEAEKTVRLYSGADGDHIDSIAVTHSVLSISQSFEVRVAFAGDVDADGQGDFMIFSESESANGLFAGAVIVYSGSESAEILRIDGETTQDALGYSLAAIGDVDCDGHDDLLIGVPGEDRMGLAQRGAINIYSGADGSLLSSELGQDTNDRFGAGALNAGDLNGDGIPDYVATSGQLSAQFSDRYITVYHSELIASCPGDCDLSGGVDFGDLVAALFLFDQPDGERCDVDGSGTVGFGDLVSMLFLFGPCPEG